MIGVGFSLQPERAFLELLDPILRADVDYFEVAPETMWRVRDGQLVPNGFHGRFAALREATGRPFVAHGVAFSVGSRPPHREAWLARLQADHAVFDFRWYTDHLASTWVDGQNLTLPLPLPPTEEAAATVREALRAMQTVVPDVGVENTVTYFTLGPPDGEPDFLRAVLRAPRTHLLLDLHNLYTMARNLDFDVDTWLARAPLDRVIEIHVSGGVESPPGWLPEGRTLRLDSHDAAVPEAVWGLLDAVLPRCPAVRGVTLERMEGTVTEADVPQVREELRRLRRAVA